jgi:hypothetical protein
VLVIASDPSPDENAVPQTLVVANDPKDFAVQYPAIDRDVPGCSD